jgi:hypothetical protein
MENKRKNRLLELKDEHQRDGNSQTATGPAVEGETEGDAINKFIKHVVEHKKSRKQQLEIVQDFFNNPTAYGVDTDIIPSSTTEDEINARKKELQHKIDLLRSVLRAFESEMQLLSQIKIPDENSIDQGHSKASITQQTILEKKIAAEEKPLGNSPGKNKAGAKKTARKKTTPSKTKR